MCEGALGVPDGLVALAAFLLVASVWTAAMIAWGIRGRRRAMQVSQRLGLLPPQARSRELRLWHDGQEAVTTVPDFRRRRSILRWMEHRRQQAGWDWPLSTIVLGLAGMGALAAVVVLASTGEPVLAAGGPAAVATVFWIYLTRCAAKRQSLFERQFIDGLELAARSLRAGHPLVAAFRLIGEEIPSPVGGVFARIVQQQSLGMSLEDSLRHAAAACASDDLKLFATTVVIQHRCGGNLAGMMERLAEVIRDRIRLNRHVRVLTAQTQFSKRLLLAMPFLMFVVLNVLHPEYVRPLYTTSSGRFLLTAAGAGLAAGAWIMGRMAKVKF